MNGGHLVVLENADVWTMDRSSERCTTLAFRNGAIVAVGDAPEVSARLGEGGATVARVDMGGRTVIPGFFDLHQHPALAALYGHRTRLVPPLVTDIPSLLSALSHASAQDDSDRPLVATDWDEARLRERRPPTRDELDSAVPNRPLFALHFSCHRAVANTRALEQAGLSDHSPDPPGGQLGRSRDGRLNGLLIERAMSPVESLARRSLLEGDAEGIIERLGAHHKELARCGITRVFDAAVPLDFVPIYREAELRGALSIHTTIMPVSQTGYLEPPWDVLEGLVRDPSPLLAVGPVKMILDGAPGCATCLRAVQMLGVTASTIARSLLDWSWDPMRVALSLRPRLTRGGSFSTGILLYPEGEAERVVLSATERGLSVALHAEGNTAIELALRAFASAGTTGRIEHGMFLSRELASRVADQGATVVAQPVFLGLPAMHDAPTVPGMRFMALRWLLDSGAAVAASSDYPVVGMDPLEGIRAAVSRRTCRGRLHDEDQAIALDEAVALYTREAAACAGCASTLGTLSAGKQADLVVLDRRLALGDALAEARVAATVVAGDVRYGSLSMPLGLEGRDAVSTPRQ